jgi:hypothetical protein
MATYKEFGIAPEIYSGTTDVSSFSVDVDSSSYMTEIWGTIKPVNQTLVRIGFSQTGVGQLNCTSRTVNSGITNTYQFDSNYFVGAYYSLGTTNSNAVHFNFQLKYFSENSSSSPFAAPWIYLETFYESSSGTQHNAMTGAFLLQSGTPDSIRFYAASGNIDYYYVHKISTLQY